MVGIWLGLIAAVGNLVGGGAVLLANRTAKSQQRHERSLRLLLYIGAGFLLAVTVLEMIPAALENAHPIGYAAAAVLGGYLLIHALESFVSPHSHAEEILYNEPHPHPHPPVLTPRTVYGALTGLIVHAAFDGVAVGSGSELSRSLGWLLTIAIVLHKIPEGATVTSLSLLAGLGRRSALIVPALLAVATLLGSLVGSALPHETVSYALGVAAGVTLYVAASDLVPHARDGIKNWRQSSILFVGVGLFVLTDLLLKLVGVV